MEIPLSTSAPRRGHGAFAWGRTFCASVFFVKPAEQDRLLLVQTWGRRSPPEPASGAATSPAKGAVGLDVG